LLVGFRVLCPAKVLRYHTLVVDAQSKILPWYSPREKAFDNYLDKCWAWAVAAPNDAHGLPISFLHCAWRPGNPPAGAVTNGFLTLSYTKIKAATDITCTAVVAPNVAGPWLPGGSDVEQLWQTLDGLATQTITARDKTPVSNATSRFMRLKVTQP
jgi:hypothetical protein